MSEPSLDEKIGQMIMLGFRGLTVDADSDIAQDIHERHIGSVVLFNYDVARGEYGRNIQSPEQVQALTAALQENAQIPLLVAVDQEGGYVNRLRMEDGFPPTVSAQHLGELDDVEVTRQHAETVASTLASLGINFNLAPCVDLNLNPENPVIGAVERSFSADPGKVVRHAAVWIDAHRAHGVRTCIKHFPGHGSSLGDTHDGFTDVTNTWTEIELEPFVTLLERRRCDAIMTSHIFNANLDPQLPATLSHRIIVGLLREQMGYSGVVVSDDLGMRAISSSYSFETGVELAVKAGVDILAMGRNTKREIENVPDTATRALNHIRHLVETGEIGEERIDRSYRRIQRLKQPE